MRLLAKRSKLLLALMPIMAIAFYAITYNTSLKADNTFRPVNKVPNIIVMLDKPASGSPADYPVLDNIAIANKILYDAAYFEAASVGEVKASVATQSVYNSRKIKNGAVFTQSISVSPFVKIADQKYVDNGAYLYRKGSGIKGNSATFGEVREMSEDSFYQQYGMPPRELCKYVVNETTVLEAVPVSFPSSGKGDYVYRLSLDPQKSTEYYANEVRTLSGATGNYPIFKSVTATVTMDSDWLVKEFSVEEQYEIDKPMKVTCYAKLTETFSNINAELDIPEAEPFLKYVPTGAPDEPAQNDDNPILYLGGVFEPYLGGQPLYLKADVWLPTYHLKTSLTAAIDLLSKRFDFLIGGELYISYRADENAVYFKAGGIRGFLPADAFSALLPDLRAALPSISPKLAEKLSAFDLSALAGDDGLSALLENATLSKGDALNVVAIPIELDGVTLNVKINVNAADDSLASITAGAGIFNVGADIKVVPCDKPAMPETEGYADLSPVAGFIKPLLNTLSAQAFSFDLSASVKSEAFTDTVTGTARLNRPADEHGLSADGSLTLNDAGLSASFAWLGDVVYASIGNLTAYAPVDELKAAFERFTGGFSLENVDWSGFDLGAILDKIVSLETKGNFLTLRLDGVTVTIVKNDDYIVGLSVETAELNGTSVSASLEIAVRERSDISKPDIADAISLKDGLALYDAVAATLKSGMTIEGGAQIALGGWRDEAAVSFTVDKNGNLSASADLRNAGAGAAALVDGTLYLSAAGFDVKAALFSPDAIDPTVQTPNAAGADTVVKLISKILPALKRAAIADNALTIEIALDGLTAAVELRYGQTLTDISAAIACDAWAAGLDLQAAFTPGAEEVRAPEGEFTDLTNGSGAIPLLLELFEGRELTAGYEATIETKGTDGASAAYAIAGELGLAVKEGKAYARMTANAPGVTARLLYRENAYYLELGETRLRLDRGDVDTTLAALGDLIPPETARMIAAALKLDFAAIGADRGASGLTAAQILSGLKFSDGRASLTLPLGQTELTIFLSLPVAGGIERAGFTITTAGAAVSVGLTPALGTADDLSGYLPSDKSDYADLKEVAPFIAAAASLVRVPIGIELDAQLSAGGFTDRISGTAVVDAADSLRAEGSLSLRNAGLYLGFAYLNDTLYLKTGKIAVKAALADVTAAVERFTGKAPSLPGLDSIDFAKLLGLLGGITVRTEGENAALTLTLNGVGRLTAERAGNALTRVGFDNAGFEESERKFSLLADIALSPASRPEIVPPENAVDLKDGLNLFDAAVKTLREGFSMDGTLALSLAGGFSDALDFSVRLAADGGLDVGFSIRNAGIAGRVVMTGGRVYLRIAGGNGPDYKISFDTLPRAQSKTTLPAFVTALLPAEAVGLIEGGTLNQTIRNAVGLLSYVRELTLTENAGRLAVAWADGQGGSRTLILSLTYGQTLESLSAAFESPLTISLNAESTAAGLPSVTPPDDADGYVNASKAAAGQIVSALLEGKTFETGIVLRAQTADGDALSVTGNLAVSVKDGRPAFALSLNAFGVAVDVRLTGGAYYLKVGDLMLKLSVDDRAAFIAALRQNLPAFIAEFAEALFAFDIEGLLSGVEAPTGGETSLDPAALLDGLSIRDGRVSLALDAAGNALTVSLPLPEKGVLTDLSLHLESPAGTTLDLSLTDPTVSVCASLETPDKTPLYAVSDEAAYLDAMQFTGFLEAIKATVTAAGFELTLSRNLVIATTATAADGTAVRQELVVRNGGVLRIAPEGKPGTAGYFVNIYANLTIVANNKTHNIEATLVRTQTTTETGATTSARELFVNYNGLKIKISYEKLMGIIGYAKQIIGITDETILDEYLDEYLETIDTEIFRHMQIVGLDSLKTRLVSVLNTAGKYLNAAKAGYAMVPKIVGADNLNGVIAAIGEFKAVLKENGLSTETSDDDIFHTVGTVVKTLASVRMSINDGALNVNLPMANGTADVSLTHDGSALSSLELDVLDAVSGGLTLACGKTEITRPADHADDYDYDDNTDGNGNIVPKTFKNDAGENRWINASNLNDFLVAFINTANLRNFHITGKLALTVIGIKADLGIDIRVKLLDDGNGGLTTFAAVMLESSDTAATRKGRAYLYYYGEHLYFIKNDYSTGFFGLGAKWNESYKKYTVAAFLNDPATPILDHFLPLSSAASTGVDIGMKLMKVSVKENIKVENVISRFGKGSGVYNVNLAMSEVLDPENLLSNLDLYLTTAQYKGQPVLEQIELKELSIFGIMTATIDASLQNYGVEISAIPVITSKGNYIDKPIDETIDWLQTNSKF